MQTWTLNIAFLSGGRAEPMVTPAVKKCQCLELRGRAVELGSFGDSGSFLGPWSSCGLYKYGHSDQGSNYRPALPALQDKHKTRGEWVSPQWLSCAFPVKCTLGPWPQGDRETTATWKDQLRQNTSWALVCAVWKMIRKESICKEICACTAFVAFHDGGVCVTSLSTLVLLNGLFTKDRQNEVCFLKS